MPWSNEKHKHANSNTSTHNTNKATLAEDLLNVTPSIPETKSCFYSTLQTRT